MKGGNISVGSAGCLAPRQDCRGLSVVVCVFTLVSSLLSERIETYTQRVLLCHLKLAFFPS